MNIPEKDLEYALQKFIEKGVNLEEGSLREMTIEALDEMYVSERDTIAEFLPPDGTISVQYPAKFISDTSELRRKLPLVPMAESLSEEPNRIKKMEGVQVRLVPIDDNKVILSENITADDLLVYCGICTWIDNAIGENRHDIKQSQRFFTPAMIYNCINPAGEKSDRHLDENSPEIEAVRKSIDKLRHIKIYLNYSGFIQAKKGSDKESKEKLVKAFGTYDDWFINAAKVTISVNGKTLSGYEINAVPPMYWASKKVTKQLATYERKLLKAPGLRDSSRSGDLNRLKHTILEHITTLKSVPKMTKSIKYETLFDKAHIEIKDKAARTRRRKQVKKFLDYQIQEGNITGYTEYMNGTKAEGITFSL